MQAYESSNPDPITFVAGELVKIDEPFTEDPDWANWVKCENADGKTGWTPVQLLRMDDNWATALDDYTAHELTVALGDQLTIHKILNGWAWAQTETGERGWIPLRHLQENEA